MLQTEFRVLCVEDDRVAGILFAEALRGCPGVEVRLAETASEALELADDWRPQLLVIDAHLPDLSGGELLARLRRQATLTQVPAYMCSADAEHIGRPGALAAGFTDYWSKPVEPERWQALVAELAAEAARQRLSRP